MTKETTLNSRPMVRARQQQGSGWVGNTVFENGSVERRPYEHEWCYRSEISSLASYIIIYILAHTLTLHGIPADYYGYGIKTNISFPPHLNTSGRICGATKERGVENIRQIRRATRRAYETCIHSKFQMGHQHHLV